MKDEKPMTASEFVRRQPMILPVADVIRAAKAAGIAYINAGIVYQTRSVMRRRDSRRNADFAAKLRKLYKPTPSEERVERTRVDPERELMALAAELGLARSRELLDSVRERVRGRAPIEGA